jgi:hypothetical protein
LCAGHKGIDWDGCHEKVVQNKWIGWIQTTQVFVPCVIAPKELVWKDFEAQIDGPIWNEATQPALEQTNSGFSFHHF